MFLSTLSDEGKKLFYELEVLLAEADGIFDASEEAIIIAHCYEMGIEYTGRQIGDRDVDNVITDINETLSEGERKAIFIESIIVSLADEEYHNSEKEIINKLSSAFKISKEKADEVFEIVSKLMTASKALQSFITT